MLAGIDCLVSRCDYTGEDGFEIWMAADDARVVAQRLLDEPEVVPPGLGARDLLRLEAGLCFVPRRILSTISAVCRNMSSKFAP
jgi:glycine cleavage system T protein (aminomethyltransferase)